MTMERYLQLVEAIDESVANLRDITERFADDPTMLAIYQPSSKFAVDALKQELIELLGEDKESADLTVRLKGEAFENGKAPAKVVADFLRDLTVATQHAVGVLHRVDTRKGRPKRRIQQLAQFELVGVSRGSFVLELEKPMLVEEIDSGWDESSNEGLFDGQLISDAMDEILYTDHEDDQEIDGFLLLIKALRGTDEDINLLEDELGINTLTLLHHAKKITPSLNSAVDEIEFAGSCLNKIGIETSIVVDHESRKNLDEFIVRLSRERKVVEGYGWLNEADIDKNTGILRNVVIGKDSIKKDLPCTIIFDDDESSLDPRTLGELVQFKGLLTYSKTYEPAHIELFEADFKIVGESDFEE